MVAALLALMLPAGAADTAPPSPGDRFVGANSDYALRYVPPGTFRMARRAKPPERNPREVTLTRGLWIGELEVTQALWRKVQGALPEPSTFVAEHAAAFVGDTLPVHEMSWCEAVRFANAMSTLDGLQPVYRLADRCEDAVSAWVRAEPGANGYRLPTSAEWEWAARAVGPAVRPIAPPMAPPMSPPMAPPSAATPCAAGNVRDRSFLAIFPDAETEPCDDAVAGLAPVGRYAPNGYGLMDLAGNVFEWTWDRNDPFPADPETDPQGGDLSSHRVARGGAWNTAPGFDPLADTMLVHVQERAPWLGIRLARSP